MDVVDTLSVRGRILASVAVAAFVGAAAIFVVAVVSTNAVYGTRMAWFVGLVLPLLVVAAGSSWWALRSQRAGEAAAAEVASARPFRVRVVAGLFRVCVVLIAIPFVFAAAILLVYGLLFVVHSL